MLFRSRKASQIRLRPASSRAQSPSKSTREFQTWSALHSFSPYGSPDVVCERGWLIAPQFQLGAENNIEKSRCLAQMRKKIRVARASHAGFSGLRSTLRRPPAAAGRLVRCDFRHVERDVQRSSTNKAPMAMDTQRTEKSIWPIGGIMRRTGLSTGSHNCPSSRNPGAYPPGDTKLVSQ